MNQGNAYLNIMIVTSIMIVTVSLKPDILWPRLLITYFTQLSELFLLDSDRTRRDEHVYIGPSSC